MVTVAQLIAYLKRFDPNTRVVHSESEVTYPVLDPIITMDSALALIDPTDANAPEPLRVRPPLHPAEFVTAGYDADLTMPASELAHHVRERTVSDMRLVEDHCLVIEFTDGTAIHAAAYSRNNEPRAADLRVILIRQEPRRYSVRSV